MADVTTGSKTTSIMFRCTEEQKLKIFMAAAAEGFGMSEWILRLAEAAAARVAAGRPGVEDPPSNGPASC